MLPRQRGANPLAIMARMDDQARRVYRSMALAFVGVGAVFLGVAVLEPVLGFELLNNSPVRVALFLMAIGGALWSTVRKRPEEP